MFPRVSSMKLIRKECKAMPIHTFKRRVVPCLCMFAAVWLAVYLLGSTFVAVTTLNYSELQQQVAMRYCDSPSLGASAAPPLVLLRTHTLVGLAVAHRHGDRVGLHAFGTAANLANGDVAKPVPVPCNYSIPLRPSQVTVSTLDDSSGIEENAVVPRAVLQTVFNATTLHALVMGANVEPLDAAALKALATLPADSVCSGGQLTPRGVAQLYSVGAFIAAAYLDASEAFERGDGRRPRGLLSLQRIAAVSTSTSRTVWSAGSVIAGIRTARAPVAALHQRVPLYVAPVESFSGLSLKDASWRCQDSLKELVGKHMNCELWNVTAMGPGDVAACSFEFPIETISDTEMRVPPGMSKPPRIIDTADAVIASVCGGRPLACTSPATASGEAPVPCVTPQIGWDIFHLASQLFRSVYAGQRPRGTARRALAPLLRQIFASLADAAHATEEFDAAWPVLPTPRYSTEEVSSIFSASSSGPGIAIWGVHDTVILPLAEALGVAHTLAPWPPYAAALFIEAWVANGALESRNAVSLSDVSFRFILAGVDVTRRVEFCPADAPLCPSLPFIHGIQS